jgi:pimeloyl-ACP methyl ester carboxylesterase
LITLDRAGYGLSDPRPEPPTFLAGVSDLTEVLDALRIAEAAFIGFSGGGPHALACAALAPDRVVCVTTVCSSSGPMTDAHDDPALAELARAVRADPVAARERVREHASHVLADLTWATRMTEQYNPQVFDAPMMRELYQRSWNEGSAVSVEGYVDDWIVRRRPYDFELDDIDVPAFVWFGQQDVLCPTWHADALVASMRNSTVFGCPDCRHYVPIGHWPEILDQSVAAHTG